MFYLEMFVKYLFFVIVRIINIITIIVNLFVILIITLISFITPTIIVIHIYIIFSLFIMLQSLFLFSGDDWCMIFLELFYSSLHETISLNFIT